jgi:hypothetical protein
VLNSPPTIFLFFFLLSSRRCQRNDRGLVHIRLTSGRLTLLTQTLHLSLDIGNAGNPDMLLVHLRQLNDMPSLPLSLYMPQLCLLSRLYLFLLIHSFIQKTFLSFFFWVVPGFELSLIACSAGTLPLEPLCQPQKALSSCYLLVYG